MTRMRWSWWTHLLTSLLCLETIPGSPCLYSPNPEHNVLHDVALLTPQLCATFPSSPPLFLIPLTLDSPTMLMYLTHPNTTIYSQHPAWRLPSSGSLSFSAPGKSQPLPPLWSTHCVTLARCSCTDFCSSTYCIVCSSLRCCTEFPARQSPQTFQLCVSSTQHSAQPDAVHNRCLLN